MYLEGSIIIVHNYNMTKMYRVFIVLTLIFTGILSTCDAMPYIAGKCTVDISVRNSAMNLIFDAKVSCYMYDENRISLSVKANGYVSKKHIIKVQPNQTLYKHDFILADVKRNFYVTDRSENVLSSAYVRLDQIGFPSNRYGMTVYIPVKNTNHLVEKDIDIFETFWGFPIRHDFSVETVGEFHKVKLSISRKALKWSGEDIIIQVRSAKTIDLKTVKKHLQNLENLDSDINAPTSAAQDLTKYIVNNVSKDLIVENDLDCPRCLTKYYSLIENFKNIHKNI